MAKKVRERVGLKKIILGLVIVLISVGASFILYKLANYNKTFDEFSLSVRNYDRLGSEKGFEALKKSYVSFSNLGLQYFADKYLFKEMYKYEAALAQVNEDWEKVSDFLADHDDDCQAQNMLGIAKFRVIKESYQSDAAKNNQNLKDENFKKVLEQVNPYFESAVKKCSGSPEYFNYAYNYDLTSDPELAKRALESVRPGLRYVLGIKVEGDGPKRPGRSRSEQKRIDDPDPGGGDAKKRG